MPVKERKQRKKTINKSLKMGFPVPVIAVCTMFTAFLASEVSQVSNLKCMLDVVECNGPSHIAFDKLVLNQSLQHRVYGQEFATKQVYKAVVSHFESKSESALVLSFHGSTGIGKNYIANKVIESIYKRGLKSRFVHLFQADVHFAETTNVANLKRKLKKYVVGNVTLCPHSFFLFDEADHMPKGVLDSIAPFLNQSHFNGVDFSKSIFIFLSNQGGDAINGHLNTLWEKNRSRNDMQYDDIDGHLRIESFFATKGFKESVLVSGKYIDRSIPLIGLEREHVKLCIRDVLLEKYPNYVEDETFYAKVMDTMVWMPSYSRFKGRLSKFGCKKVRPKIEQLMLDEKTFIFGDL